MIVTGNLRYSIQVIGKTVVKDIYGAETVTWTNKIKLRADRKFMGGDKTVEGKEIFNSQRLIFTTHYRKLVNEDDRIVFDGKTYLINSIVMVGFKEAMQIDCELIND